MADSPREQAGAEATEQSGPVIRDRRRLDPETGKVRAGYEGVPDVAAGATAPTAAPAAPEAAASPEPAPSSGATPQPVPAAASGELEQARRQAEERLADLQRLQAEYVNYRRRVERDRDVAREQAKAALFEALLPVLDDVHLARTHGDLEGGPFSAIAEKLEMILERHGLSRYGEPGEAFDPTVHEALIHTEAELAEGTSVTTVVQVLQPGYLAGERVLRAARVAVADPR